LTKSTGEEINTGTDDAKYVTPKAIADSDIAFLSDIPFADDTNGIYTNENVGIGTGSDSNYKLKILTTSDSSTALYAGSEEGIGVYGASETSTGVYGITSEGYGVRGVSVDSYGGYFESTDTSKGIYATGIDVGVEDLNIQTIGKGVVIKSQNGTRYRITVDNSGNLATTAL